MTDRHISRRDWFRLRSLTRSQEALGEGNSLQPISEPPNHDGLDLAELPPMHEAVLSADQVRDLFADLRDCARDVQLIARRSGNAPGTDQRAGTGFRGRCQKACSRASFQGDSGYLTL